MCSSECPEPDPGFDEEPAIQIVFHDGNQNFITSSLSVNISKHLVIQSDLPGVDMNSNSTKYWISRGTEIDSFVINYKLSAYPTNRGRTLISFDSLYIKESSFINAEFVKDFWPRDSFINFNNDSSSTNSHFPVFYIRK